MSENNLEIRIKKLLELEAYEKELEAEAETIRNELKEELSSRGIEELQAGEHIVRWVQVLSSRFDTRKFKEAFGSEVYKAYCREVPSKRFAVL